MAVNKQAFVQMVIATVHSPPAVFIFSFVLVAAGLAMVLVWRCTANHRYHRRLADPY
jgi:hypothetical protein